MTRARTAGERIPSLDGLRAVSILLVVVAHLWGAPGFVELPPMLSNAMGELGVRTFFVISGFLITSRLLEEAGSGRISLRDFYIRRVARIFPAFYVYLLALVAASAAGWIVLTRSDLLQAATYTVDYFPWFSQTHAVRHIWSLSVEEQFYLIWPLTLFVLGAVRAPYAAGFVVIAAPVYRLLVWFAIPPFVPTLDRRFDCVVDCIAAGCLFACIGAALARDGRYQRLLASPWFAAIPALVVVASLSSNHPKIYYGLAQTVINIGLALTVHRSVLYKESRTGRLLNAVPLTYIGTISYSIYLWQQPFLGKESAGEHIVFPLNLALACVAAVCSYYLVERPLRSVIRSWAPARPRL